MTLFRKYLSIKILFIIWYPLYSGAQAPPGIPYQAIARTTTGEPYASGALQARFSLHEQTATGTVSYAETHSLQTDAFGLFSTTFGAGTPTTGTFASINWGLTTKYLQVEIDLGNGWIDMGTQQLMSVPYAMYAGSTVQNSGLPCNVSCPSQYFIAPTNMTVSAACQYCATLQQGGRNDWRLPELWEYEYLLETTENFPYGLFLTKTYQSSGGSYYAVCGDRQVRNTINNPTPTFPIMCIR
jgi:hypothetical protein